MAISSSEYKSFLFNALAVIPRLRMVLPNEEYVPDVIKRFDEIRQKHKKIKTEWDNFKSYPKHNTAALKEAVELTLQLCEQWGIDPVFPFPNNVNLNEDNWKDYRKIDYSARYHYKGVEITDIIEF